MKKTGTGALAVLSMLLLIFAILITSFDLAVYGDKSYKFYEKEYEKYDVLKDLDMEMGDVMDVTVYMMDYLKGREENLTYITMVDGTRQDFFNEQDRLHMKDVQDLFVAGIKLRNMAVIISLLLVILLALKKVNLGRVLPKAFGAAFIIYGVAGGVIGTLFAIDFTKYFTIFHEIFFSNDLWVFDYNTDYMIRMLPEGFFNDFLGRIGVAFVILLLMVLVIFGIIHYIACYKFTKSENYDTILKDKNPNLTEENE